MQQWHSLPWVMHHSHKMAEELNCCKSSWDRGYTKSARTHVLFPGATDPQLFFSLWELILIFKKNPHQEKTAGERWLQG